MAQSHEEGTEQQGWIKTLSHCHHCHSPLPTAQPFVCIVHCASVRCTGYSIICAQKLPRPRSSNLLCIHYPIISISISKEFDPKCISIAEVCYGMGVYL